MWYLLTVPIVLFIKTMNHCELIAFHCSFLNIFISWKLRSLIFHIRVKMIPNKYFLSQVGKKIISILSKFLLLCYALSHFVENFVLRYIYKIFQCINKSYFLFNFAKILCVSDMKYVLLVWFFFVYISVFNFVSQIFGIKKLI